MARRDHYRLEVLNAQAAKLQEVDAELGQIERMVKLDEAGAAGSCPYCGALQARGASFCWRCGKDVTPAEPKAAKATKPRRRRRRCATREGAGQGSEDREAPTSAGPPSREASSEAEGARSTKDKDS